MYYYARVLTCLLLGAFAGESQVVGELPSDISVRSIAAAWNARYSNLETAEFLIDVTQWVEEGYYNNVLPARTREKLTGNSPKTDERSVKTERVWVKGPLLRIDSSGPVWHVTEEGFEARDVKNAFNGTATKMYQHLPESEVPQLGTIGDDREVAAFQLRRHMPLAWWLSKLWGEQHDLEKAISLVDIKEDASENVDLVCLEYKRWGMRLWVDPARDYVVTRWCNIGPPKWEINVDCRKSAIGWMPVTWLVTNLSGERSNITKCVVREFSLNKPQDNTLYDIAFPVGTWVQDFRGGQVREYKVDKANREIPLTAQSNAKVASVRSPMLWANIAAIVVLAAAVGLRLRHRITARRGDV